MQKPLPFAPQMVDSAPYHRPSVICPVLLPSVRTLALCLCPVPGSWPSALLNAFSSTLFSLPALPLVARRVTLPLVAPHASCLGSCSLQDPRALARNAALLAG
jgi:hypothetical protein